MQSYSVKLNLFIYILNKIFQNLELAIVTSLPAGRLFIINFELLIILKFKLLFRY